ncbi:MAG: hypothetical protein AAFY28_06480 [Actinomycetota bacterium]
MSDDPIEPDDVSEAGPRPAALAQRAVDTVLLLVRRGTALAGGALMVVTLVCLASFALGLAALDGGVRTVWIILGGFFAIVAIGSIVVAMFRLIRLRARSNEMLLELRELISGDTRSSQVIIETIETSDGVQEQSAVVMSRTFDNMQGHIAGRSQQFRALASAMRAITTFPLLLLMSTAITIVFGGLALIFLIALAIG